MDLLRIAIITIIVFVVMEAFTYFLLKKMDRSKVLGVVKGIAVVGVAMTINGIFK